MSDYIQIEVKEDCRIFSIRKEHINSVTLSSGERGIFRVNINSSGLCTNEEFDCHEKALERYKQIMGMLDS